MKPKDAGEDGRAVKDGVALTLEYEPGDGPFKEHAGNDACQHYHCGAEAEEVQAGNQGRNQGQAYSVHVPPDAVAGVHMRRK